MEKVKGHLHVDLMSAISANSPVNNNAKLLSFLSFFIKSCMYGFGSIIFQVQHIELLVDISQGNEVTIVTMSQASNCKQLVLFASVLFYSPCNPDSEANPVLQSCLLKA